MSPSISGHKLFIGSIPAKSDPGDLLATLRQHSRDVKVISTFNDGLINAGFCIIRVPDLPSKTRIINSEVVFRDRKLDIKEYRAEKGTRRQKKDESRRRIFIKNLPKKTEENELEFFFEKFGQVKKVFFLKAELSKGQNQADFVAGHVVYKDEESVKRALKHSPGNFFYLQNGEKIEYGPYLPNANSKKNYLYPPLPPKKVYNPSKLVKNDKNDIKEVEEKKTEFLDFKKTTTLLAPNCLNEMLGVLSEFQPISLRYDRAIGYPYPIQLEERAKVGLENQISYFDELLTPVSREVFRDEKRPLRGLLADTFEEVKKNHVRKSNIILKFSFDTDFKKKEGRYILKAKIDRFTILGKCLPSKQTVKAVKDF